MDQAARAPAFVGREREQAALRAFLRETAEGRLRVALVEGEAGIGKTRLVQEALVPAEERGAAVFIASCEEYESARAFAPLARAFGCAPRASEPRRVAVAGLLAARTDAVDSIQFRLIDSFLDLMEATALERPLVLVVEDLHWADPATIAVLRAAPALAVHPRRDPRDDASGPAICTAGHARRRGPPFGRAAGGARRVGGRGRRAFRRIRRRASAG